MDLEKLTVHDCMEMSEKEKAHVVIHAGKVTDVIKPTNKGAQRNVVLPFSAPIQNKHL